MRSSHSSIPAWMPRPGQDRAIVAIVGENSATELTDFVIPFGVFKRAGIETVTVAMHQGSLRLRPALLHVQLDGTAFEFDARHPAGADYVIVPAIVKRRDPTLLAWLRAQADKGATLVSICDGAMVLAEAGVLEGKQATAHWASERERLKLYPGTKWIRNARYVVDEGVVSSSGISAAMPTAIALVEAIAGPERAARVAGDLGVSDWGPRHDSDAFRPRYGNLRAFATTLAVNRFLRRTQRIGVPVADGVDEIALALTADAYSRTGRSQAIPVGATTAAVTSRHGLILLPGAIADSNQVEVLLPAFANEAADCNLAKVLADIRARYGRQTAHGVALDFEYPAYLP